MGPNVINLRIRLFDPQKARLPAICACLRTFRRPERGRIHRLCSLIEWRPSRRISTTENCVANVVEILRLGHKQRMLQSGRGLAQDDDEEKIRSFTPFTMRGNVV